MTMVYDDYDYLDIWLRYWTHLLPLEDLHVLIHGENPKLEAMTRAAGLLPRIVPRKAPYEGMEEDRWVMLSETASLLLDNYQTVVYTDIDEILVPGPNAELAITELLMQWDGAVGYSQGLEIIHRPDLGELPLTQEHPILKQRPHYRTTSFHSKPCIITKPVTWGRGGHFCNRPGLNFIPDLYTIHLRFYDQKLFLERAARRKQTTMACERLRSISHRQWRYCEEKARSMLEQHQSWRVSGCNRLHTWPLRARMRWSYKNTPRYDGLYHYKLFASTRLAQLPHAMRFIF